MHVHKSKCGRPRKKKKQDPVWLILPTAGLGKRQGQNNLKLLGVTLHYKIKFKQYATNVTSKAKKVMGIIGESGDAYKGISWMTMKQLYISCVRPMFGYDSPDVYIQNIGLPKTLEAFKSAPVKAMRYDAGILPVNLQMEEIRDQFAM